MGNDHILSLVAIVANGAKDFFCQSFDWASLVEALRFDSGPAQQGVG
jgi:hypothetical protein